MEKTIYQKMVELGVEMDHYESDLYVVCTKETTELLKDLYDRENYITLYRSEKDRRLWYEIPFAYDPWWDERKK